MTDTLEFKYTGFVRGCPCFVHYSKEYGLVLWPVILPRVCKWWWSLFNTKPIIHRIREIDPDCYEYLDVNDKRDMETMYVVD